jgi:hypothetical protein
MFLVSTFCEIIKNGTYILKIVKKNFISFSVLKNDQFRLFFQGHLTKCLLVDRIILILVPTFCKVGNNDPYILKNYGIFFDIF